MSHSPGPRAGTPAAEIVAALAGSRWSPPEVHTTIGSTNAEALTDPRPGRVVIADHQSTGRGRMTRTWSAPPGAALAISAVLPLPSDQTTWGWVPLFVGRAVRDALSQHEVEIGLKWPNDVLGRVDGGPWGKLAGILCQSAEYAGHPVVVVGVGINIDLSREELPVETATSLTLLGSSDPSRSGLACDVLAGLADAENLWSQGGSAYAAAQDDYRAACVTLGQFVRVEVPGGVTTGEAVDVDADGRLVLAREGTRVALGVGDVIHVRPGSAA